MSTTTVSRDMIREQIQRALGDALGPAYKVTATSDSTLKVRRFPLMTAKVNVKWDEAHNDPPRRPRRSADLPGHQRAHHLPEGPPRPFPGIHNSIVIAAHTPIQPAPEAASQRQPRAIRRAAHLPQTGQSRRFLSFSNVSIRNSCDGASASMDAVGCDALVCGA
jgi:hypothetical protein